MEFVTPAACDTDNVFSQTNLITYAITEKYAKYSSVNRVTALTRTSVPLVELFVDERKFSVNWLAQSNISQRMCFLIG